jgi:uncharacterized membrane protein
MKATKIIYWISTAVFGLAFLTTGTLYLIHSPRMVTRLVELGYPFYMLNILGTAKLLGAIALVVPKYPRLKEWAYVGFVIDFVGAIWSHLAVQSSLKALPAFIALTIVIISYVSYHSLQSTSRSVVMP